MPPVKNKRRLPCRNCQHTPGFKHFCTVCQLWFCQICVCPGKHTLANLNTRSNWKMVIRHEPTLTEPSVPVETPSGSPSAAAPLPHDTDNASTTLQPGSRILVRYKPTGHHSEIDNKLKHLVFERLILWNFERFFFVATPDYELCIEPCEWWTEIWTLQDGRYSPRAHGFGRNLVYHFPKAFSIMELTELISAGRLLAQACCRSRGHAWCDINAGVDFYGEPFSYRYLEPNNCCLNHILWTNNPYAALIESVFAKAKQEPTRLHRLLEWPSHLS